MTERPDPVGLQVVCVGGAAVIAAPAEIGETAEAGGEVAGVMTEGGSDADHED